MEGARVEQPPATSAVDLTRERALVEEAAASLETSDYATARSKAAGAVAALLARREAESDASWLALLDRAGRVAWDAQDARTAKEAWQRLVEVRSRTLPDDHPDLQTARGNLAITMCTLGDVQGARVLFEKVLEIRSRTLPDDHRDLQATRQGLANTLHALGDLESARVLEEQVLEVLSRTLPDDHRDLQVARLSLAGTLYSLGDLEGARALEEKVLAAFSRTLPEEHPDLQAARLNLAGTMFSLGDLRGARTLQEEALAVLSRTLPGDHRDLQVARMDLAVTMESLGDLQSARALEEQVLAVLSRTLPDDHPDLQAARQSLASTMYTLGDLQGARVLEEEVLEVLSRTLPDDHPDLQAARQSLASTMYTLGDLQGARVLDEKVLEVRSRTLPDDHPALQAARGNLATTIKALGDLQGARALLEKELEVRSRTLPDDHPDLQAARQNLALTIKELGDLQGARALLEKVLEVRSRTLPEEHRELQAARLNLAGTLHKLGDFAGARALEERALEVLSRTLPDDHPELQAARLNLALTMKALGDVQGARALFEEVLEVCSRTLPDDHPFFQMARQNLAVTIASLDALRPPIAGVEEERSRGKEQGRRRFGELAQAFASALRHACASAILDSSSREAEERIGSRGQDLALSLSFAEGLGVFERDPALDESAFLASETARSAALSSVRLARRARMDPEYETLRERGREASAALSKLAQSGASAAELAAARAELDRAERELVRVARRLSGPGGNELEPSVAAFATRLKGDEALLAFRRYRRAAIEAGDPPKETSIDSLCAFVLRPAGSGDGAIGGPRLVRVELGPIAPIEQAVDGWRQAIGAELERGAAAARDAQEEVRARGAALRASVLDPLAEPLEGVRSVVVVLDDVLHGVPLDALPAGGPWDAARTARDAPGEPAPLGAGLRIEVRSSLLELLAEEPRSSGTGGLLALGHAAFDSEPVGLSTDSGGARRIAAAAPRPAESAGILRGGAWERGFTTLPETRSEVQGIRDYFDEAFGDEGAVADVLERRQATRESLFALAPKARFLHIATHGWFAADAVRSIEDPEPLDRLSGLGLRTSGEERVRGMSPMLLCGLALAGANLPADATGRIPGLVTAEELSTLDLTGCELAVLSACDTNVGVRRAGQGVASLQRALHMAGARSVITSLWKVPDEATKDLMIDFYRRIWIQRKPKAQALWEAKMKLRAAKDDSGRPRYATRDWAAWVLTGEPD